MSRDSAEWRRRLAGQVAFDPGAAEAAIRRAYRAAALPEPSRILWVDGPREAADMLAFLENAPRRLRRFALALSGVGALACPGLALLIDHSARRAEGAIGVAFLAASFVGFSLLRASLRPLPLPPGAASRLRAGTDMVLAAVLFVALAACLFVPQQTGLPAPGPGRGAVLVLFALVGALPGGLLVFRLHAAYAALPPALGRLPPCRSVAQKILRARRAVWRRAPARAGVALQEEALVEVYRQAWREAFVPPEVRPDPAAPARAERLGLLGEPGLLVGAHAFGAPIFGHVVPHLDGVEDCARAAEQGAAGGAAADFADLAFRVDRLYPFRSVALAVRPPTVVALDAEGRPHAEAGPALAWADGTRVHAWRGRAVDPDLLDEQVPLRLSRINREFDPGRRGVLIERYGLGRYLTEVSAREVHRDACGRLYYLEQPRGEPIVAVRVTNATPDPDGSVREFWLRVPPTMMTAREAVAWTFGLSPSEYDPAMQS